MRLMPGNDTLEHICMQTNYLAYCQKNFNMTHHPSPIGNGWAMVNGRCHPIRNSIPALPDNISSGLISSTDESSEESGSEDDMFYDSESASVNESDQHYPKGSVMNEWTRLFHFIVYIIISVVIFENLN